MDITVLSTEELEALELRTYRERERIARAIEQSREDLRIANANLQAIQQEQDKRRQDTNHLSQC